MFTNSVKAITSNPTPVEMIAAFKPFKLNVVRFAPLAALINASDRPPVALDNAPVNLLLPIISFV